MCQSVRQGGGNNGGGAVGSIPRGDAKRLLGSAVPLAGDDAEERQAAGFKQTEEETGSQQAVVIFAGSHAGLCDAPSQAKRGHENAMRHLDDEERGKGLPCQLGNGGHGADEGVLIAHEARVFLEAVRGAVAEDGLVENLQEVDPDEDGEDDAIRLAADAAAVLLGQSDLAAANDV